MRATPVTPARTAWMLSVGLVVAGIALRSLAVDPPFEVALFVIQTLALATVAYQHHALVVSPGTLPFGRTAAWLQAWVYVPAFGTFGTFLPQLFPTGRPASTWSPPGVTSP